MNREVIGEISTLSRSSSDLRQIQFHTLECVSCPPVSPLMIKPQRPLERTLFQAPYMDQITFWIFEYNEVIFIIRYDS